MLQYKNNIKISWVQVIVMKNFSLDLKTKNVNCNTNNEPEENWSY